MQFRKLGNTGYDVSTLGFGTWQIGGGRWVRNEDSTAISLLQHARDCGINIFDAAVVYGQYRDPKGFNCSRSLELLGKAFKNQRDRVIYCVKLGQLDEYSHRSNYNPINIIDQLRQALALLQTDYIDICLVHAPSAYQVQKKLAITILQTLQALGMVKAIGYSFENEPLHVRKAIEQQVDVIMLQHNLLEQDCEGLIYKAQERGIGILVGGPLKRGYLSGQYSSTSELPLEDDYWRWNLALNSQKTQMILDKVAAIKSACDNSAEKLRQQALNYILNNSAVCSAVVGFRTQEEILENIQIVNRS